MNTAGYDELTLKSAVRQGFGLDADIQTVILPCVNVSRTGLATVFLTTEKELLVYIESSTTMLLADVKKIISRMGLKADLFIPPRGQPRYFDDIGREKYHKVFPGLKITSDNDLTYYRTLAPYNPALVSILEVKDGFIYQFDPDARGQWRVGTKFHYRRVLTN